MKKKVLVISTSPRRGGNTDAMCHALMEGAESAGSRAAYLNLNDYHISPCRGCDYCMSHDGVCVQRDDMEELLKEISEASVLVLATPVYFYNMSAQLKVLLDRTYCRYQGLKTEKVALLAACADERPESFEAVIAGVKGYVACLEKAEYAGGVFATGVFNRAAVSGDVLADARRLGAKL